MNRRTFIKFLALFPLALRYGGAVSAMPTAADIPPVSGQFVFDGVNGLTFPASSAPGCLPTATRVVKLRALSLFERIFGGMKQ